MSSRFVASILSLVLAMPALSVAPAAQGPTCGQIAAEFDRQTAAFVKDADQQNLDFVQKQFGGNPLRDPFESAKEKIDQAGKWAESLNTVYLCLMGNQCNTTTLRDQVGAEVRGWLDAKLSDRLGLAEVRDRARDAANLLRGYVDRALKISTDTMSAMTQCSTAMKSNPRADLNSLSPKPTTADGLPDIPEPPSKPVDPPKEGGGSSAIIWGLAAAGGAVYAVSELMPQDEGGECTVPSSNPLSICSSQGGGSTACKTALSDWGAYCKCTGKSGFNAQTASCQ